MKMVGNWNHGQNVLFTFTMRWFMYKIDSFNRNYIIERYVDDIVGQMHFLDIKSRLKDYLLAEKFQLTNEDLENEISRHDPQLLSDIYIEEIMEEVTNA